MLKEGHVTIKESVLVKIKIEPLVGSRKMSLLISQSSFSQTEQGHHAHLQQNIDRFRLAWFLLRWFGHALLSKRILH